LALGSPVTQAGCWFLTVLDVCWPIKCTVKEKILHWNQQVICQHYVYYEEYQQQPLSAALIAITGLYKSKWKLLTYSCKISKRSQTVQWIHTQN
jgi:hypothetical protein